MPDTVYLVDTYASLFRWYHAHREALTNARGEPTHAVRGMVLDIQHFLKKCKPSHLVYCTESDGRGKRAEIDPNYKANRSEMPADLASQIPKLTAVLDAYGIPLVSCDDWEADDVIASLAKQAEAKGMNVRIVSNDKDLRQLITDKVEVYNVRKQEAFDADSLWSEWGIRPDQVIDFQSLVGDSVDNIPGVPLVGPKKAQALLDEYETLDAVLANAEKVKGKKLSSNLVEFADQARMCKKLVTLNVDLPCTVDWEAARLGEPDVEQLHALFVDYDFKSFAEELRDGSFVPRHVVTRASAKGSGQGELFDATDAFEGPGEPDRRWQTVDSDAVFAALATKLGRQDRLCVDLETTSLDPMRAEIVGWSIAWAEGESAYVPVRGPEGAKTCDADTVLAAMKTILEDGGVRVDNQNLKYDWVVLRRHGVDIAAPGLDPMVCDYLLDAGARSHGFDELCMRYFNHKTIPIKPLIGVGKKQITFDQVPIEEAAEYATEDADYSLRLADLLSARLEQAGLKSLYDDLEQPLIGVLTEMELTGFHIDPEELERQSHALETDLEEITRAIYEAAGSEFNADSPKQLAKILFEDLGLPVQKRTKTGPSTDAEVLERLAASQENPLPRLIIERREMTKLKGTYLDALPKLVHPETGRIHASFNQTVAATGRLSTSDPNLQNIPVRTEQGRRVRRAFIPGEAGWRLVAADYSQIELRFLAHFCRDPAMVEAFDTGVDVHTAVAADVFGVDVADVVTDQRRVAKAVNFGVIYGQTAFGLSANLGIPRDEAQTFIDAYFEKFASVKAFIDETLDRCLHDGYAETILGRRRPIEGIRGKSQRRGGMNFPERTAFNAVIQGSAADLMKRAMLDVHAALPADARMLLQVHDELIFETPEASVPPLAEFVRETMRGAMELSVPLVVDVKSGENWLDAEGV